MPVVDCCGVRQPGLLGAGGMGAGSCAVVAMTAEPAPDFERVEHVGAALAGAEERKDG